MSGYECDQYKSLLTLTTSTSIYAKDVILQISLCREPRRANIELKTENLETNAQRNLGGSDLDGAAHDHDGVVQRALGLLHELLGPTPQDDGARLGLRAALKEVIPAGSHITQTGTSMPLLISTGNPNPVPGVPQTVLIFAPPKPITMINLGA